MSEREDRLRERIESGDLSREEIAERLSRDTDVETAVESTVRDMADDEPITVREVQNEIGDDMGLSRDQTENRLTRLADAGVVQSKKGPGRTSPQIFWRE